MKKIAPVLGLKITSLAQVAWSINSCIRSRRACSVSSGDLGEHGRGEKKSIKNLLNSTVAVILIISIILLVSPCQG